MARSISYQDFMLTNMAAHPSLWRRIVNRLWRQPTGRFYPTQFKKLPGGRMEVTFNLPPKVLREMQSAITSGKRIRLFVP